MDKKKLAAYIDHTLLKAVATEDAIKKLDQVFEILIKNMRRPRQ